MKIFRGLWLLLGVVGFCLGTQPTAAAGVADGSVPLVCVPLSVTECGADDECQRGSAASINPPQFLQVNVQAMTIRAVEQGRQSPIGSVTRQQGKLILQGVDGRHGGSVANFSFGGKIEKAGFSNSMTYGPQKFRKANLR